MELLVAPLKTALPDEIRLPSFRSREADRNGFSPQPGFAPFELAEAESDLGTRFKEMSRRCPDRMALIDEIGCELSYAQLFEQASRVALAVSEWHADHPSAPRRVAIAARAQAPAIAAILGSLLAGCAYFAVDPAWPDARIAVLLTESKAGILLFEAPEAERLTGLGRSSGIVTLEIEPLIAEARVATASHSAPPASDLASNPASNPASDPGDTAAIFATSGSTGKPKLVALSHRAVLFDIGRQVNDLFLGPGDCFDLLFSIGFSASLAPIFGALLTGARLCLFDAKGDLGSLPAWLAHRQVSISTLSVSTLRSVFLTPRHRFTGNALRLLSVGGEPLLAQDVEAVHALFPASVVLQNAMAATETRTYAQFFVRRSEKLGDVVPIGWPVAGKEVILLEDGVAVEPGKPGEVGEIGIRSRYLASGYIHDDAEPQQRFALQQDGAMLYRTGDLGQWAPDGSLIFLGRADTQVKIRGHRVELLAVEAALRRCPGVANCTVVAREDEPGDLRLVAYVTGLTEAGSPAKALRASLAVELPDYMIPSHFVSLEALPLNSNGKIDRHRLPAPSRHARFAAESAAEPAAQPAAVAETTTEADLRQLWSTVLGLQAFSRDATFAELGGDSLRLVQLRLLVRDRFGFDLATARLASAGTGLTLADAAALIECSARMRGEGSSLTQYVSGSRSGAVILIPGAVGNFFNVEKAAQLVGSDWPVYGLDLQDALWRYPASSMAELANAVRMEIQAAAGAGTPLVLVGYCLGAQLAFEVARQTAIAGGGEPLVCAIDTSTVTALQAGRRSRLRAAQNALFNLPQWLAWNCAELDVRRLTQGVLRVIRGVRRSAPEEEIMGIRAATGDEEATLPTAVLDRMRANYEAVTGYVPGSYSGPIAVFRTWRRTLFADRDPTMGWGAVSSGPIGPIGPIDVQWISGLHHTCMDGQYLAANMTIVNSRIQAFARSET